MHVRRIRLRRFCLPVLLSVVVATAGIAAAEKGKPSVSVKASPVSGFAPMRTVVTVELKGGADDYEEFYCATVEWDITVTDIVGAMDPNSRMSDSRQVEKSEQKADCDPYVAGKSEIKRRFVREHTFKIAGEYSIKFSLKQKNKVVGSGRTTVRVRGGLGDGIGG